MASKTVSAKRYSSTSRLVLQYQIAYTKKILMDDLIGSYKTNMGGKSSQVISTAFAAHIKYTYFTLTVTDRLLMVKTLLLFSGKIKTLAA